MSTPEVVRSFDNLPAGFGLICAMDETGDTPMQWDKNNPEEVAKAQARFDDLKKKGSSWLQLTGQFYTHDNQ